MTTRRGYSLIEVLVVMAVGSVVLGTAVGIFHTLMLAQRAARRELHWSTSLGRLADQFRQDVHAAAGVTRLAPAAAAGEATPAWQLRLGPADTVRYRLEGRQLVRSRHDGEKVVRREWFALPPGSAVSMDWPETGPPPVIVRLRITVETNPADPVPGRAVSIEAALGSDRRFTRAEKQEDNAK